MMVQGAHFPPTQGKQWKFWLLLETLSIGWRALAIFTDGYDNLIFHKLKSGCCSIYPPPLPPNSDFFSGNSASSDTRGREAKALHRKSVQENEADEILTIQNFPNAHKAGRKLLEPGLITVGVTGSLVFGGGSVRKPPNQIRASPQPLKSCLCTVFFSKKFVRKLVFGKWALHILLTSNDDICLFGLSRSFLYVRSKTRWNPPT